MWKVVWWAAGLLVSGGSSQHQLYPVHLDSRVDTKPVLYKMTSHTRAVVPAFLAPAGRGSAARKHRYLSLDRTHTRGVARRYGKRSEGAMNGVVIPAGDDDILIGTGRLSLWLDMRTCILPAQQVLQGLYDELRLREEAMGRTPEDPDWSLRRVPNPVGALLFAADPAKRATKDFEALAGALPCYQLSFDGVSVMDVPGGNIVGTVVDPTRDGGGVGAGAAAVASAQESTGSVVLLSGVKPSAWEDGDMANVVQIAAGACRAVGKTLVVNVKSVRQMHDSAIAALVASQTKVLGQTEGSEEGVVLLIEPAAELWEAGLSYL